jgi:hypothetical protein
MMNQLQGESGCVNYRKGSIGMVRNVWAMMRGEVPDTRAALRELELREFGALGAALRKLRDERERVAGLVALCEDVLDEIDVAATGGRVDVSAYQERLAKLKGGR